MPAGLPRYLPGHAVSDLSDRRWVTPYLGSLLIGTKEGASAQASRRT